MWLFDAGLQCQAHLFTADWWSNDLAESVMGQPAMVSRSILWVTGVLSPHAGPANSLAIAVQAAIGLCLVIGRLERVAISASVPWALAVWWLGEGLGGLPTGFAQLAGGAPGPVLFYPLITALAWPRRSTGGDGREQPVPTAAAGVWLAVWLGGAVLELPWRFPTAQVLQANLEQNSLDQPRWLSGIAHASYDLVGAHRLALPAALVLAQIGIAIGVVGARTRPYALAAGAILAVLFWVAVQGFGGILSGSATDPGSGPLLVLLAFVVPSARHRMRGAVSDDAMDCGALGYPMVTVRPG
jgi:hypothetical protein